MTITNLKSLEGKKKETVMERVLGTQQCHLLFARHIRSFSVRYNEVTKAVLNIPFPCFFSVPDDEATLVEAKNVRFTSRTVVSHLTR